MAVNEYDRLSNSQLRHTGTTSGVWNVYPSGAPEFTPGV
jgi:hypothetical protein